MSQFIMIYNASGTILGELKFITSKIFFGLKCGACDISHSIESLGEKSEFCTLRKRYSIINLHTNELDENTTVFVKDLQLPVVLERDLKTFKLVFTAKDLEEMKGSVDDFERKLVNFCSSPDDLFSPQEWTLNPDPPQKGNPLSIYIKGMLKERVEGGTAHVQVKLGFIQLLNQDYDLCEYVGQVEKECPLEEGEIVVDKSFDIPGELPPGRYRIHVTIYRQDSTPISCLEADFRM